MNRLNSPFVGLTPYDESSCRYFCGRDRESTLVTAAARCARIALVYGPSGSGKSSVICAGVVPKLKDPDRIVVTIRNEWKSDLVSTIQKAIDEVAHPAGRFVFPDSWLTGDRTTIPQLVLILDQFEDLFYHHPSINQAARPELLAAAGEITKQAQLKPRNREGSAEPSPVLAAGPAFAATLVALLNDPAAPVNVLLGIREDCLAQLDVFKGIIPGLLETMLRIEPFDETALRSFLPEILDRWSADHSARIEFSRKPDDVDFIDALVADEALKTPQTVGRKDVPARYETPFLQMILERMWLHDILGDVREGEAGPISSIITAKTYAALGRAPGIRKAYVTGTLDKHLRNPDDRRWFFSCCRYLVSKTRKFPWDSGELAVELEADPDLARPLPTAADLARIFDALASERLMRRLPDPVGGPGTFEIAHDSLAGDVYDWRREIQKQITHQEEQAELARQEAAAKERLQEKLEEEQRVEHRVRRAEAKAVMVVRAAVLCAVALCVVICFAVIKTLEAEGKMTEAEGKVTEAEKKEQVAKDQLTMINDKMGVAIANEARLQEDLKKHGNLLAAAAGENQKLASKIEELNQILANQGPDVAEARSKVAEIVSASNALTKSNETLREQVSQGNESVSAGSSIAIPPIPESASFEHPAPKVPVRSLAFLKGAPSLLAIGSAGDTRTGMFRINSLEGGSVLSENRDCQRIVAGMDGRMIASFPWGGNQWLLFSKSGQNTWSKKLFQTLGDNVIVGTFTQDCNYLVTGSKEHCVAVWDVRGPAGGKPKTVDRSTFSSAVTCVVRAEACARIWAGGDDGTLAGFDVVPSGQSKAVFSRQLGRPVKSISCSNDGKFVLAFPTSGSPWVVADADSVKPSSTELSWIEGGQVVAADPHCRVVAAAADETRLRFWRIDAPDSAPLEVDTTEKVVAMAWSGDGTRLIVSHNDGLVRVCNAAPLLNGTPEAPYPMFSLQTKGATIDRLAVDSGGNLLAGGGANGDVMVWHINWHIGRYESYGHQDDKNIKPDSGLAIFNNWKQVEEAKAEGVFQSGARSELIPYARLLDPNKLYVSFRWNYEITPKQWLREHKVTLMNPRTHVQCEAQPVDWGPALSSGKILHLSPAVIDKLGLKEEEPAAILIPRPAR